MSYKEHAQVLESKVPIVELRSTLVIEDDIDPYANHLHHTGPFKIFAAERKHILGESRMPILNRAAQRDFVCETLVRYAGQVQEGDEVEITSKAFQIKPTVLTFQHIMRRNGIDVVSAVVDMPVVDHLDTSPLKKAMELENFEFLTHTQKGYLPGNTDNSATNHDQQTEALKIFEAERVRIFNIHGMPPVELAKAQGLFGFVYELAAKFNGPLKLGNPVDVTTGVFQTRRTILSFHQMINKGPINLVEAVVDVALVDSYGRPVRIPQEVVNNLKRNTD